MIEICYFLSIQYQWIRAVCQAVEHMLYIIFFFPRVASVPILERESLQPGECM